MSGRASSPHAGKIPAFPGGASREDGSMRDFPIERFTIFPGFSSGPRSNLLRCRNECRDRGVRHFFAMEKRGVYGYAARAGRGGEDFRMKQLGNESN